MVWPQILTKQKPVFANPLQVTLSYLSTCDQPHSLPTFLAVAPIPNPIRTGCATKAEVVLPGPPPQQRKREQTASAPFSNACRLLNILLHYSPCPLSALRIHMPSQFGHHRWPAMEGSYMPLSAGRQTLVFKTLRSHPEDESATSTTTFQLPLEH